MGTSCSCSGDTAPGEDAVERPAGDDDEPMEARKSQKVGQEESNAVTEGSEAPVDPEVLRVRTAAGNVVLSLQRSQVGADMSGETLRAQTCKELGKSGAEVQLVKDGLPLKDSELAKDFLADSKVVELLVLTIELPEFDDSGDRLSQLPSLRKMLFSEAVVVQRVGAQHVRKMLSVEHNPPIQEVIDAGFVPRLVELGKIPAPKPDTYELQFEALWALTNIASGTSEHTMAVLDAGGLPVFVEGLRCDDDEISEQSVWALGNIAGDSPDCRDRCLEEGALPLLLRIFEEREGRDDIKMSLKRNATWCLSNMCRGRPPVALPRVAAALPVLGRLIADEDAEVCADACWATSYMCDTTPESITAVIEAGLCPRLAPRLQHGSALVQTPALRALGNLVTGDEAATQAVLDCGVLPMLSGLMAHAKKSIRKEACWFLSNVLAGSRAQIQSVLDATTLLPRLCELAAAEEYDVRKEAVWAILNAISGGSEEQLLKLGREKCLTPLVRTFEDREMTVPALAARLQGIAGILGAGAAKMSTDGLPSNPMTAILKATPRFGALEALRDRETGGDSDAGGSVRAQLDKIFEHLGHDGSGAGEAARIHRAAKRREDAGSPKVARAALDLSFEEEVVAGLDAGEYGINLLLSQDRLLGVSMVSVPPRSSPKPGTLLYDWNRRHPDRAVSEGDLLLAVNGVRGDFGLMRAELKDTSSGARLQLIFQRSGAARRT